EGRENRHDDILLSRRPRGASRALLPRVRGTLDGSAGGTRDDDPPSADADAGADRRQQEREALLAEGPFEWRGHADVVPHPDPPREFHISSSPAGMAAQGLRPGSRGREEERPAARGLPDPG